MSPHIDSDFVAVVGMAVTGVVAITIYLAVVLATAYGIFRAVSRLYDLVKANVTYLMKDYPIVDMGLDLPISLRNLQGQEQLEKQVLKTAAPIYDISSGYGLLTVLTTRTSNITNHYGGIKFKWHEYEAKLVGYPKNDPKYPGLMEPFEVIYTSERKRSAKDAVDALLKHVQHQLHADMLVKRSPAAKLTCFAMNYQPYSPRQQVQLVPYEAFTVDRRIRTRGQAGTRTQAGAQARTPGQATVVVPGTPPTPATPVAPVTPLTPVSPQASASTPAEAVTQTEASTQAGPSIQVEVGEAFEMVSEDGDEMN